MDIIIEDGKIYCVLKDTDCYPDKESYELLQDLTWNNYEEGDKIELGELLKILLKWAGH